MKTFEEVEAVVKRIAYPGIVFEVGKWSECPGLWFVRVVDPYGVNNRTGEDAPWTGRKWVVSPHMTDGEIVQTVFKALLTAMEHEARELFTYGNVPVLDPHYDINELREFRLRSNSTRTRDEEANED